MSLVSPREQHLNDLGYQLPQAPAPAAIYQPYMKSGQDLWVAGQIAMSDGALIHEGRVGIDINLEQAQACAFQCALNLLAQVKAASGSLEQIKRVIKLNVFVASDPCFTQQHLVANAASKLFGQVLGADGVHARSAVGVAVLPLNSPVEIDAIFELK